MIFGTYTKLDAAVPIPKEFAITTESVEEAYKNVLARAGASPRDAVDERVVHGVRNQSGRIIFSQSEVGGWPELKGGTAPKDSDQDGIPDQWELAHGLDPDNSADAPRLTAAGYSNLETYLDQLAGR